MAITRATSSSPTRSSRRTDRRRPRSRWDEYPSFGNADLDLTLDVRRFQVKNNIAPTASISKARNPDQRHAARPAAIGSIRVSAASSSSPARARRSRGRLGSIDFAENDAATKPAPRYHRDDPDFTDLSGQQHIITLTITGTLEAPQWDLKHVDRLQQVADADAAVPRAQPRAAAPLARRSIDRLRPDAHRSDDEPVDGLRRPDRQGPRRRLGVGPDRRQASRRSLRLDVLRFEIGFGDVGIYAEKNVAREHQVHRRFRADDPRPHASTSRGEFKTPWHLPWHAHQRPAHRPGVFLYKNYYDPAEEDIKDYRGQLVYRLFIPPLFP